MSKQTLKLTALPTKRKGSVEYHTWLKRVGLVELWPDRYDEVQTMRMSTTSSGHIAMQEVTMGKDGKEWPCESHQ
eukprot:6139184-Amphidinium_carterae.1